MVNRQDTNGLDAGNYSGYVIDAGDAMAVPPPETVLEDSLSQSLLRMSMTDRNAIEEEVHGVRCLGVMQETQELLQTSLEAFNWELLEIKNNPHRIATLQNTKKPFADRFSKSNGSDNLPPTDVLRNVIDTTDDPMSVTGANSTIPKHKCYVNDPDVRLRFLRCENFDAKAATKRFVNFLNLSNEVFGDSVADRPIRLIDFIDPPKVGGKLKRIQLHEKKAFSNSMVQYMPFRDRSGRRVKVAVGGCNSELDLFLRIKINMILDWIASEDVESQQKGVVNVVWPFDPPTTSTPAYNNVNNSAASGASTCSSSYASSAGSDTDEEGRWESSLRPRYTQNVVAYHKRYYQAMPIRVAAMHWCSQDKPINRILNSLYYFSLDSKAQSRYKVCFGEPLEIRYYLQGFGIPVDLLPVTHTMALKRQNHLQWIASRKYIEEQQKRQQQQEQQQQRFRNQQLQYHQQFLTQPLGFFESIASTSSQGSSAGSSSQPIVVECPRSYDVLIGKAKVCANNPGNGYYSSLIEASHDEHDSLVHAKEKVVITWKILLHITEERNGCFLDWNKSLNSWVVIEDKAVIRKKIANSFKEYKRSRYNVASRSANGSQKKKHAPIGAADGGTADEHTNGNTTNRVNFKRRKIDGCIESACGGGDQKDIESMFAGL